MDAAPASVEELSLALYEMVAEFLAEAAPTTLEALDDAEGRLMAAVGHACADHDWNFRPS